ncbi:hypothetical protein ACTXT7_002049 [Hymenolepis weldensis]
MDVSDRHRVLNLTREEASSPLGLEDYYDIDKKFAKPGFKTRDGQFNWSCSCVASYITSPCGFYFRKFLSNMDRFMNTEDSINDKEAKQVFEECYSELGNCMRKYPKYYRPILEQFEESLSDVFRESMEGSK